MKSYEIIAAIATGGMGAVYRARHTETGRIVALKTVRAAGKEVHFQGIRREIYALTRLSHPGVVRFLDSGVEDGTPWYAMELVEGPTLRDLTRQWWEPFQALGGGSASSSGTTDLAETGAPAPVLKETSGAPGQRPPGAGGHLQEALAVVRQLCQTLASLHGEGIVHRDLKPENIVLPSGGPPVLVDFGIAQNFAGATGRETIDTGFPAVGTPAYMAPEQIQGQPLDARADLYALGCILFELLCGRPPFLAASQDPGTPAPQRMLVLQQHLTRNVPRPSLLADGISEVLEALVLSLLAKDPHQRCGYAEDVGATLESLGARASAVLAGHLPRTYLYRPRFAGRADAVGQMEEDLWAAQGGRQRFAFLTGPSGFGKTRLAIELGRAARAAGTLVASGECAPWSSAEGLGGLALGAPLQAFRPLLQIIADRCRLEGPLLTEEVLADRCRALAAYEPALAQVPGWDCYAPPPALPPADARDHVLRCMLEVVLACSRRWPLLLIIDDAQWADDLTIGVLSLLATAAGQKAGGERPARLMTLVTCRSEAILRELDPVRNAAGVVRLPLSGLGAGDIRQIAEDMTACDTHPQEFLDFLVEQCGGNPFFASEYLKAALMEGLLYREHGRWHFRARADVQAQHYRSLLAPKSIQELLSQRLRGLLPVTDRVLRAAAVLGRSWDGALAVALAGLPGEQAADEAFEEMRLRQIAEPAGPGHFRFAHDRIQETAYSLIPAAERTLLHRKAAEALDAEPRDAGMLAHHYRLGGVPDKAFHYAREAGRRAMALGAYREAAEHIEGALQLAQALDESGHGLPALERGELLRRHAEVLYGLGSVEAMSHRLREAATALGLDLPRSRAGWGWLILRHAVPLLAHRLLAHTTAHAGDQADEKRILLAEKAVVIAGLEQYFMYRSETLPLIGALVLSANISERAGALVPLSRAQARLANILGILGSSRLASYYFRLSADHARRSGDLVAELEHARTEAFYYMTRARLAEARALILPCLARSQAAGLSHQSEQSLIVLAMLLLDAGEMDQADAVLAQLYSSAERLGHGFHAENARTLMAYAALLRGRYREALELAAAAEQKWREDGDLVLQLQCIAIGAGALLGQGDLDGAIARVQKAYAPDMAKALGNYVTFYVHRFGPAVYLHAWARARRHGDPGTEWARLARHSIKLCNRYRRLNLATGPFVLRHRARMLALQGKGAQARRTLRRSAELAAQLGLRPDEELAYQELKGMEP